MTEFTLAQVGGKPTELAVAPDGAVWFTDNGHAAVGRLAPDGTVRMFPLTLNRQPASIAVAPDGGVWFTQYAWYNAGRATTPTGQPAPPPDPATIGPPAIGRISADGIMAEFRLPTAEGNRMGAPDMGSLPRGIVAGPDGAMWFTEGGADQIGRIAADGSITEYPLPSRDSVHAYPDSIVAGSDGALWFSETLYGAIGRIDVSTGAITEHKIEPQQSGVGLLAAGSDGALWFGQWSAALGRMTTAGKTTFFGLAPKAQQPNALAAGPDGRLWFANDQAGAVFRMTTKGAVSQLLTVPGLPAKDWEALGGLAVGPDKTVWLAAPSSNRILRISCGG
jgi:virginiamycin B lyase